MLGGAGHFSLEGGEVGGYAIDVEVDEGLLAFGAEEEGAVGGVVHEHVFYEDAGAEGVAEEGEAGFLVGVAVGVVGADAVAGEVAEGGVVEGGGEGIGRGVATGGVGAPAGGVVPAVAAAGGVAVDGDEPNLVDSQQAAPLVHPAAALLQGDVRFLRDQELRVQPPRVERLHDPAGDDAVHQVFPQAPVRASLAGSFDAVAIVDEDFHSCVCVRFSTVKLHKISRKCNRYGEGVNSCGA